MGQTPLFQMLLEEVVIGPQLLTCSIAEQLARVFVRSAKALPRATSTPHLFPSAVQPFEQVRLVELLTGQDLVAGIARKKPLFAGAFVSSQCLNFKAREHVTFGNYRPPRILVGFRRASCET